MIRKITENFDDLDIQPDLLERRKRSCLERSRIKRPRYNEPEKLEEARDDREKEILTRLDDYAQFDFYCPADSKELAEDLEQAIVNDEAVLVIGERGWGKTGVVNSVARKLGWAFHDLPLSRLTAEDLGGFPRAVKKKDEETDEEYEEIEFIPFKWARDAMRKFKKDGTKTVLFLDEVTHASQDVKNAAYRLIDRKDRRIADISMKGVISIVAACNFKDENPDLDSGARNLPFIDRFDLLFVAPKEWKAMLDHLFDIPEYAPHKEFFEEHIDELDEALRNPRNLERILRQINNGTSPQKMRVKDSQLKQDIILYVNSLRFGQKGDDNSSDFSRSNQKISAARKAIEESSIFVDDKIYFKSDDEDLFFKILKDTFDLTDEELETAMSSKSL